MTIIYLEKNVIVNYTETKVNITINQLHKVTVSGMKSTTEMEAVNYSEMVQVSTRSL